LREGNNNGNTALVSLYLRDCVVWMGGLGRVAPNLNGPGRREPCDRAVAILRF